SALGARPTGITWLACAGDSVSIRHTVSLPRFATHTAPAPAAIAAGSAPTATSSSTAPERGSNETTSPAEDETTHTRPNPTATPLAPPLAGSVSHTTARDRA